jgi:hypothetical protein
MKGLADILNDLVPKKVSMIDAEVVSVDKDARTCVVKTVDFDVEIEDVKLTPALGDAAKPFCLFPAEGSIITIGIIEGGKELVMIAATEVDSIYLGGKEFSMVKAETLTTELNKMKAQLDAVIQALTTWIVVPSDGGAALLTTANALLSPLPKPDFSEIKNEEVKHG